MRHANEDDTQPTVVAANGRPAGAPPLAMIPAPLVRVLPDGTVGEVNDRAAALLRRAPAGIAGRPLSTIVAEADRAALDDALAHPDPFTLTTRAEGVDSTLCLDVVGPADDGSRLVGLSVAALPGITPIADRRLAELMLAIDEGFVVFDTRPSIVECNEASLRILNTTREQLIGRRSLTEAGFPILAGEGAVLSPAEGPVGRCLATGEPVEDVVFRTSTPGGPRWIKASVRPIKGVDGTIEHVVSYFTDVTRAREVEDLLDLAERRFGTLVEQLPLVVYVGEADESTTSIYVSPQVVETFGVSVEAFSDNDVFWSMVHEDDRARVEELLAEQLRTNGRFVDEYRLNLPDGRLVWVWDESVVICDDDGNARYVQGYYLDVTEQRAAREALRLERERFAQLAENIEELFYVWDLAERRFVYMSPAYERLTGSPAEDVYADPLAYLASVHHEDVPLVTSEAFAEQGDRGAVEFRFIRPDGTSGWLLSRWFPVIEGGVPVRVVGLAQDITERKRAEEALDEERIRFAQLASSLQGIFTILDVEQGRYLYVSPAYETLTGRSLEKVYDDPDDLLQIVHPDDLPAGDLARQAVFAGEESEWEFRYLRADGSLGWAWNRRYPIVDKGRVRQIIGFTEDVTERHQQQFELELERERFRTLADNIDGVFWIQDVLAGRIVYVSPAFDGVFGFPRENLYRRRDLFLESVHPDDRAAVLQMIVEQQAGVATVAEYRIVHPGGSERWIRDRAFPIVEGGRVVRVAGLAEDVSERRRDDAERAELTRRWRELFTDAPVMYVVCSPGDDGRLVIEDVNDALLEALERDRSDMIGEPADELYDHASLVWFWQAGQPGALPVHNRERTLTSRSGRRIDVLIDAVPVLGPGGDVVTVRGTLTDVTAKKAAEERLRADADALGRLGGLASSDEGIDVKLEHVLRIALDRFGFAFGTVVAVSPLEPDSSPLAAVDGVESDGALATAALGAAREMLDVPGGEVRVQPMPGRPELSLVGLPLAQAGGARGVMAFVARSDAFDAGERELLVLIAQWARYELARERTQAELRESETVHRSLTESLRRLGERVEAVREEERSRIAREVHDELGQALTALKFDLHWLHDHVTDEASERLAHMIDMVEETIDAVRRVCSDLRPPMLDDLGLVAALEWHAASFQRATGLTCRVIASGVTDRAVSPQIATEAFRITQEALTNVARHARASLADVRVHVDSTGMNLRIEDDGCGIANGDTSTGLGILGMRERALRLNGSLEVETGAEGGTRVVLHVPLNPTIG